MSSKILFADAARALLVALALTMTVGGCAPLHARRIHSVPTAAVGATRTIDVSDADCLAWLSSRRSWGATALALGSITAAAAPLREIMPDTDATRLSFGIGALLTGGISVLAAAMSSSYGSDFSRHCTTGREDPQPTSR